MYKVAVIGDNESICGYAALGLETYPVSSAERGREVLRDMVNSDFVIIYITEALAALISEEIERYHDRSRPALILIPGISGNTGMGKRNVKRSVERAVGSDILDLK